MKSVSIIILILTPILFGYTGYERLEEMISRTDSISISESNQSGNEWLLGNADYWIKKRFERDSEKGIEIKLYDKDSLIATAKLSNGLIDITGNTIEWDDKEVWPSTLNLATFVKAYFTGIYPEERFHFKTNVGSLEITAKCKIFTDTCKIESIYPLNLNELDVSFHSGSKLISSQIELRSKSKQIMRLTGGLVNHNWLFNEYTMVVDYFPVRSDSTLYRYMRTKPADIEELYLIYEHGQKVGSIKLINGSVSEFILKGKKREISSYGDDKRGPKEVRSKESKSSTEDAIKIFYIVEKNNDSPRLSGNIGKIIREISKGIKSKSFLKVLYPEPLIEVEEISYPFSLVPDFSMPLKTKCLNATSHGSKYLVCKEYQVIRERKGYEKCNE